MNLSTRPAQFIGVTDRTYVLVATLSGELLDAIANVQKSFEYTFPGVMWAMPRPALHITLMELMQRGQIGEDKDAFYEINRLHIHQTIRQSFKNAVPIPLVFKSIVVSPDAITAQSHDVEVFNVLRKNLVGGLLLPPETKTPPPIVHTSIARFTKAVPISELIAFAESIVINTSIIVDHFELRRTSVQPMQEFEILESFPL